MALGATTIGSFQARLGIDTNEYGRGMLQAQGANRAFGESVATFIGNPLFGAIGMMRQAGGAAIALGDRVLNLAEGVIQLNAETGISTDVIQALRGGLIQATGSAEQADAALRTLTKGIGELRAGTRGGALVGDALKGLGIDPRTLGEGEAGLRQVIDALTRVESQQIRTALASKLLGDAGSALAVLLEGQSGGLDGLVERQRKLGQIIGSDTLPALGAMSDQVDVLKAAIDGLLVQGMAEFLAGFQGLDSGTDGIEDIANTLRTDLVPLFRELGEEARGWVNELRSARQLIEDIRNSDQAEGLRGVRELASGNPNGISGWNIVRNVGVGIAGPFVRGATGHLFDDMLSNQNLGYVGGGP